MRWAEDPAPSAEKSGALCPMRDRYRPSEAIWMTRARRSKSRLNLRIREEDWLLACSLINDCWSPAQLANRLREKGVLPISRETIYRYIWADKKKGGSVY